MRFAVCLVGLITFTLNLPAVADDKPATASPATAKKYVVVGQIEGKLYGINTTTSEMSLEYRAGVGRYVKNERKELTLADEAKIWFATPPEKVDENGDMKKLTPAELDKLKSKYGPTKGLYAGEMADLHSGQQVRVILSKPKDGPKKPAAKDKSATEKEFVYVTQVVIVVDAKPPAKPEKKK